MNNIVLVGRLTKDPQIESKEDSKSKRTIITIAVNRNYKNSDGIYETDFIRCVLWNAVATNTCEYCKSGDVVGIKGRLENYSYEDENKEKKYMQEVVVEKITFLASKRKEEEISLQEVN